MQIILMKVNSWFQRAGREWKIRGVEKKKCTCLGDKEEGRQGRRSEKGRKLKHLQLPAALCLF